MASDGPPDVVALERRCKQLERDVSFLARGLMHALTGQVRFTVKDFERARKLIVRGDDQ